MAEENQSLVGSSQTSQQTQGNTTQTGDDFQLDFGDNVSGDRNLGDDKDLDIVSLSDDNPKADSEFNIDLELNDENSYNKLEDSNSDAIDADGDSPENSNEKEDSFSINFDAEDAEEGTVGDNEESTGNTEITLENVIQDGGENNSDQTPNNEVSDSSKENDPTSGLYDLSDNPTEDEYIDKSSQSFDVEDVNAEDSQQSDDSLLFDNISSYDSENGNNINNFNDMEVNGDGDEHLSDESNLSEDDNLTTNGNQNMNLNYDDGKGVEFIDTQNEGIIDGNEVIPQDNNLVEEMRDGDELSLNNKENIVENVDGDENTTDAVEDLNKIVEGNEMLNNSDEEIVENSETGKINNDNTGATEDVGENVLNEMSQDSTNEESKDFTLDLTGNSEEITEQTDNEGSEILGDSEDSVSSDLLSDISHENDVENGNQNVSNENILMDEDIDVSHEYTNTQVEALSPDSMEVNDVTSSTAISEINQAQIDNEDIIEQPLDESNLFQDDANLVNDVINPEQKPSNEGSELNDSDYVNNSSEEVANNDLQQSDMQKGIPNVENQLDENNGFTYEQNSNKDENVSNITADVIDDENKSNIQNLGDEVEQSNGQPSNQDVISENYTKEVVSENQVGETINENANIQATLSLDEILDSELLTNPQFADNSTAIPENIQVQSGLFNNKKVLTIFAGVGLFILAGFVMVLAFPSDSSYRKPDEVVGTGYVAGQVEEEVPEHFSPSFPGDFTEEQEQDSGFDNNTGDFTEEPDNKQNLSSSTVVFPDVDGYEEGEDAGVEEAIPYVEKREDEIDDVVENQVDEISSDDIKKIISSFKEEAESYYSYGQEVLDKNIMKYSKQIIYLCESYQQKIDNEELLNEDSVLDFTTQINEKLSKIEKEMNGGEEDVTTVESFEHDSDYDELKAYIENR